MSWAICLFLPYLLPKLVVFPSTGYQIFRFVFLSEFTETSLFFLFLFCFYFFWPHHTACGILVPLPAVEPVPPVVEVKSLNCWTARRVPEPSFILTAAWCSEKKADFEMDRTLQILCTSESPLYYFIVFSKLLNLHHFSGGEVGTSVSQLLRGWNRTT